MRLSQPLLLVVIGLCSVAASASAAPLEPVAQFDFDTGKGGWSDNTVIDDGENHTPDGSRSLVMDHKTDVWHAITPMTPGERYVVSFYIKAQELVSETGWADNQVFFRWFGDFGESDRYESLPGGVRPFAAGSYDWRRGREVFEVPDGAKYGLLMFRHNDQGGIYWIDDISVSKILPQKFVPAEVSEYSYIIYTDGNTFSAKNGFSGEVDFSGDDAARVIQAAIDASILETGGGTIFLQASQYHLNRAILLGHLICIKGEGQAAWYGTRNYCEGQRILRCVGTYMVNLESLVRNTKGAAHDVARESDSRTKPPGT